MLFSTKAKPRPTQRPIFTPSMTWLTASVFIYFFRRINFIDSSTSATTKNEKRKEEITSCREAKIKNCPVRETLLKNNLLKSSSTRQAANTDINPRRNACRNIFGAVVERREKSRKKILQRNIAALLKPRAMIRIVHERFRYIIEKL